MGEVLGEGWGGWPRPRKGGGAVTPSTLTPEGWWINWFNNREFMPLTQTNRGTSHARQHRGNVLLR